MREGLAHAGLEEKELGRLAANEPRKVALARLVLGKTTVSQGWVAERLKMRNAANVSLAPHRCVEKSRELPEGLLKFINGRCNDMHTDP